MFMDPDPLGDNAFTSDTSGNPGATGFFKMPEDLFSNQQTPKAKPRAPDNPGAPTTQAKSTTGHPWEWENLSGQPDTAASSKKPTDVFPPASAPD